MSEFYENLTDCTHWLRAYLAKVIPASDVQAMLRDNLEVLLECIVTLAYGEPGDLGCLYGDNLGACFDDLITKNPCNPCNPCALSFAMSALKDLSSKDKTGDSADLAGMFVAMSRARHFANKCFSDVEAYEKQLKGWIEMVTPIPSSIGKDPTHGSCYIPKQTLREMNEWLLDRKERVQ